MSSQKSSKWKSANDSLRKILCVDDEVNVLEGLERTLGFDYEIHTAESGFTGLLKLQHDGPFSVVVSDMQMPEMNGAEFLKHVREDYPDTSRVLLTGQANIDNAITAVNDGHIFRFLTKPCSSENLRKALDAAIEQYRLVNAERELLEMTLTGAIHILTEIISVMEPNAYGHSGEMKELFEQIKPRFRDVNSWEIESAIMLLNVGYIAIPPTVLAKVANGENLNMIEKDMVESVPTIGSKLVKNIPRLENISEIILFQKKGYDGTGYPRDDNKGQKIPKGARLVKIIHDLVQHKIDGYNKEWAIRKIKEKKNEYDPLFIQRIEDLPLWRTDTSCIKAIKDEDLKKRSRGGKELQNGNEQLENPAPAEIKQTVSLSTYTNLCRVIPIDDLRPGHIVAANIITKDGLVVLGAGKAITDAILDRIKNFEKIHGLQPIKVH